MRTQAFASTLVGPILCAGFSLLVGCAEDPGVDPVDTAGQALHGNRPTPRGQSDQRRGDHREDRRGHGHGPGHGHGCDGDPGAAGAATDEGSDTGGSATGGSAPSAGGSASATGGSASSLGGYGSGGGSATGGSDPVATGGSTAGGAAGEYGDAVCGNGTVEWWAEVCDDGNTSAGDGCGATCWVEDGWICDWYGGPCHQPACGDALVEGSESCDDGNAVAEDGCDSACRIETGYTCTEQGVPCREVICGDSLLDWYQSDVAPGGEGGAPGISGSTATGGTAGGGTGDWYVYEGCDDGNATPGDGCDATCNVEGGFICELPGEPCRQAQCGDGLQDGYFLNGDYVWEECDDGNADASDGCGADCSIEAGWICGEAGLPCRLPTCGDGYQDWIGEPMGTGGTTGAGEATSGYGTSTATGGGGAGGSIPGHYEQCDDGNLEAGDGCSASCEVEPAWGCTQPGEPCHPTVCGDGLADWPAEECDDGNLEANDGCNDCVWDGWMGTGGTMGAGGASG